MCLKSLLVIWNSKTHNFLCFVVFLYYAKKIWNMVFWFFIVCFEAWVAPMKSYATLWNHTRHNFIVDYQHSVSLGLDSCVVSSEPCFESSKVISWVLCNFRSSIICMGFVVTNVVEQVLFSMLHDVSFFFVGCFHLFMLQLGRRCN